MLLLLVSLLVTLLNAAPVEVPKTRACHTAEPKKANLDTANLRIAHLRAGHLRLGATVPQLLIPVKFIVIADGADGQVARSRIEQQITVLNEAYGGSTSSAGVDAKMSFKLQSVETVDNGNWYRNCNALQDEIKGKHVVDPTKWLYVISCSGSGFLGWSTLASEQTEEDKDNAIVVGDFTFPGGDETYGLGDTLTHEMGHFFGLLHTFQGGCSGSGDEVDDTPAEGSASSTCDVKRDTCPGSTGKDPVQNFMDYSPDACMDRFTEGQASRMRDMLTLYKPKAAANWFAESGGLIADAITSTTAPRHFPTVAAAGGGGAVTPSLPATQPTESGGACSDKIAGWSDSFGDGCPRYSSQLWCNPDGSYGKNWGLSETYADYAVNGLTAETVCCICGGGVRESVSTTPSSGAVPLPAETIAKATTECTDAKVTLERMRAENAALASALKSTNSQLLGAQTCAARASLKGKQFV